MESTDPEGAEAAVLRALESDASLDAAMSFAALAVQYYRDAWRGTGRVSEHQSATDLEALFADAPPAQGRALGDVLQNLQRDVIASSNRLAHPMAMGHQVSPPLPAAVWAEVVISSLNQSLAVREMSPTGTPVERSLLRWLAGLAGFGPAAGGSFTSGGTEANSTALLAARAATMPEAWQHGVGASPPVLVCGEHAHYSMARAAGQLGIGIANVVTVPSQDYRMDERALPRTLERVAAEGRSVMAVVASAGSTATGSFDRLEAIADACAAHGCWLHVDAAHGGSALLSNRHRHRLAGVGRADSLAWDPHKMMLLPIPCSAVLVRDERLLDAAFVQAAPYLFAGAAGERSPDQGVRSLACSRRFEALKLWVALQRYGTDGIAALYDRLCRLTALLHQKVSDHPAFLPVHEPECNILCFRWTAPGISSTDLDAANSAVRARWNGSGNGWITTTLLDGARVLRVTIMNPQTSEQDLDAMLRGLAATASDGAAPSLAPPR